MVANRPIPAGRTTGQGKGGAIFIYASNGAMAINNGSTFSNDVAASAGAPAIGNSPAPYTNGSTCPGVDTVDVVALKLRPR